MRRLRLHNILLTSAIITAGILVLSGCGSSTTPSTSSATATALAGTSWVLTSFAGPDGAPVAAVATGEVGSLSFRSDGSFSGSTGCNRFAGTYAQDGTSLTMKPGPMTLKACQDPVAAQETAVVAALPKVASFTSGATLDLLDAQGVSLLTYSPGMTGLAGTSWHATGINNGKGGVVGQAGTEKVTAEFGADGTLSGSGGCNTYTAPYTTTGTDQITMACPEPASQIEQECFASLGNVSTYQIDGTTLTLRDAGGATQVTLTPAP
jgi:heat shock protein HslJ